MNDGLKQRIVGALVLVALGIIFIPVIFDKERIVPVDRTTQIPPEPEIIAIPLPEPPKAPRPKADEIQQPIFGDFKIEDKKQNATDDAVAIQDAVAERDAVAIQKEEIKPKNSPKALSQIEPKVSAWVLQIASYKDVKLANALRDKLISQGQQAFVKEAATDLGPRFRLYLGPTVNKADLEKAKQKIDSDYGVTSIIYRFKP